MNDILYKYRGLSNFRFFTDIILQNRLFASKYSELNDPMEGQYYYDNGELNSEIRSKILNEKNSYRICSLSRKKDNELMWSHYAGGHKGVAIGLRINKNKYSVRPIQYTGLAYMTNQHLNSESPLEILSHKLEVWSYEEEERVFIRDKMFVDVEIVQVITGRAMSNQDFSFIKKLVNQINPDIEIIKANSYM